MLLGTFVTGLVAGCIVRDPLRGTLTAFLGAVLATFLGSAIVSVGVYESSGVLMLEYVFSKLLSLDVAEYLRLLGLIPLVARFPPDMLALVGGAVGAFVCMEKKELSVEN